MCGVANYSGMRCCVVYDRPFVPLNKFSKLIGAMCGALVFFSREQPEWSAAISKKLSKFLEVEPKSALKYVLWWLTNGKKNGNVLGSYGCEIEAFCLSAPPVKPCVWRSNLASSDSAHLPSPPNFAQPIVNLLNNASERKLKWEPLHVLRILVILLVPLNCLWLDYSMAWKL